MKGIAGAVLPAAGSILGAVGNKKAVKGAAAAQQAGIQQGVDALQSNYANAQQNYAPYIGAGTGATEQLRRILGLGDSNTGQPGFDLTAQDQQAGALSGLRDSPLFKSLFSSGTENVLQSYAATGGIRGGNVQNALAENGENAFTQALQQQIGNLSGLSSQGLSASSGLAGLGEANAGALAGLFGQSGNVASGSILGQQNINNNLQQQITGQVQGALTGGAGGGLSSIFGAINGGSPTYGGGSQGQPGNVLSLAQNWASPANTSGSIFTRGF